MHKALTEKLIMFSLTKTAISLIIVSYTVIKQYKQKLNMKQMHEQNVGRERLIEFPFHFRVLKLARVRVGFDPPVITFHIWTKQILSSFNDFVHDVSFIATIQ